jgi:ATP-dependent RNA helicase RhlE
LIAKKITIVEKHLFPLMNNNPVKAPAPQHLRVNSNQSRPQPQAGTSPKRWFGKRRSY